MLAKRCVAPDAPKTSDAGYTLTELIVVLVILGLIAAAITPNIMRRLGSAKSRAAAIQIESLAGALDMFFIDMNHYPDAEEGLAALWSAPDGADIWMGPYVRSPSNLIDPWGRPFDYAAPADAGVARLTSRGADGEEGGEGADRDITYPNE